MHQYIGRRLALAIPTLFGVTLMVFFLIRLVPGDVLMEQIADAGNMSPEALTIARQELGIDRPVHEQYFTWVSNLLRGNLGKSFWSKRPVLDELMRTIPVTIELALLSLAIAITIAIPAGVISAIRQDTILDYLSRLFAITGLSIPNFFLGTILILGMSSWFGYLPAIGFIPFTFDPLANLQQFIFPALVLGFALSAVTARMTRSAMLEVLRQDYIRTAWAKGLRQRKVILRHALKNAMIPVVTIFGAQFNALIGGSVIMESLFSLPGVGRLTYEAVVQRDYAQIQGNVAFLATVLVLVNLIVDISYVWFDPRIRYQ